MLKQPKSYEKSIISRLRHNRGVRRCHWLSGDSCIRGDDALAMFKVTLYALISDKEFQHNMKRPIEAKLNSLILIKEVNF